MMKVGSKLNLTAALFIWLTSGIHFNAEAKQIVKAMNGNGEIKLVSPAFEAGQQIPAQFTLDGANLSPPLQWGYTPVDCQGFALICDDPDAPMGTWVHWVVYNIPPTVTMLPPGQSTQKQLPDGTRQGITSFGKPGYGGPSPPPGKVHHYYFKLYALDSKLNLGPGTTKEELLAAMKGHILAQGQLIGTYSR